jgi:hypothetical protein
MDVFQIQSVGGSPEIAAELRNSANVGPAKDSGPIPRSCGGGEDAPHLERWHGIPLDEGESFGNGLDDQLLLCIDKPEKP